MGETINKAVLDCGASKTVCGNEWLKCYLDSIDEKTKGDIKEFPSNTIFKFGVGKLRALKMIHLPVHICNKEIILEIHVVDTDIPLLLSLKTMKSLGLHMNFETDQVEINGNSFDLEMTTTGHYTLPLHSDLKFCSDECVINTVVQCTNSGSLDVKKKALKLHRRFAHASSDRIISLLRNAGQIDLELEAELRNICKQCDFCLKHSRSAPRPIVSLPLATQFNELIAMDLKKIEGVWVLHCLDYLTRFSAGHTISSKDPDEVIGKFFLVWVSTFGAPRKVLSDNGGEFKGKKWDSFCETFNVTHKPTAAESPFSNGICERHNALIGEMVSKVYHDVGCSLDIAVMWSFHAKNSLINIFGFSPYQLAIGRNPNLPCNSTNKLPALNDQTSSKLVADHLNSMRRAREAFIQAENSNRIARALQGRVYEKTHQKFCTGDVVYFKRLKQKTWHGPGKVISQDGTQVLIKTGSGTLVKVHPCKIILKQTADDQLDGRNTQQTTNEYNDEAQENENTSESDTDEEVNTKETHTTVNDNNSTSLQDRDCDDSNQDAVDQTPIPRSKLTKEAQTLKPGDKIYYKKAGDQENFVIVKLSSRGGKKTGNHPNYWNVINLNNGNKEGVDLDQVEWIKEDGLSIQTSLFAEQMIYEAKIQHYEKLESDVYTKAKMDEHAKWKDFNVYEEVQKIEYPDHDVLSCRWVTETKEKDGKPIHKARLVIRGFEEFESPPSDSPTAQRSLARMCMILCVQNGWEIQSLDVRSAFLQSEDLDRTILMKPPKEFRKDSETLWKIKKPVYGLNDGARKWFITMKNKLVKYGCRSLKLDSSVYVFYHNGKLSGVAVVHVDDFLLAGDSVFHHDVISKLCNDFQISSRESKRFNFIGWNIHQNDQSIQMDQIAYQSGIKSIEMNSARKNQTDHELNDAEKKLYQQLLGQLQWISSQSRPDIRFFVLECSLMASKPKVRDMIAINKVVKRMNKTQLTISIKVPSSNPEDLQIVAFSDASLSNLPDKVSSTRSYIIFVKSALKFSPLIWCSKKLERVAKTILYAEGIALGKCLDEAINLREAMLDALNLSNEENVSELLPVVGVTDSKSLWENIKSSSPASDLKLRREVSSVKEQIITKEVNSIVWTTSDLQLADCLTKKSASPEILLRVLNGDDFWIDLKTYSITSLDLISHLGLD